MATYYISPTGNDTPPGNGTQGNPWATISKAHNSATSGDTIYCLNGTYTWLSQTFTKSLTITGSSAANVVFNGAGASPIWLLSANLSLTVSNLRFTNAAYTSNNSIFKCGASVSNTFTWTFTSCIFDTLTLYGTSDQAYGLFGESDNNNKQITLTLTSCLFYGIAKNASAPEGYIFAFSGASTGSTITFSSCTIYISATGANQPPNLYTGYNSTITLTWKNTIVFNATGGTLRTYQDFQVSTVVASYSDFYQITNAPTGTGIITSDPLFVDAANASFNLRPTSPCLDTGTLN